MKILTLIIEVIAAVAQVASALQRNKKKFLCWQLADNTCGTLANALTQSWLSTISHAIALARDVLTLRIRNPKIKKLIPSLLIVIGIGLSLFTSDRDLYGYIAIALNFAYSLSITLTSDTKIILPKTMQAASRATWAIYHYRRGMIFYAISDITTMITAIAVLILLKNSKTDT